MDLAYIVGLLITGCFTGAGAVWKLIHDRYKVEIDVLKTENLTLKTEKTNEHTRAETYRDELDQVRGEKERQQPIVDSVENLLNLTHLQGEKIDALECRVTALDEETKSLRSELKREGNRADALEVKVAEQARAIELKDLQLGIYDKIITQLGVKLNEGTAELSQPC